MIGPGEVDRDPNGFFTGDAGLSMLSSSGDPDPESEPEDEAEMSSVPSVLATDLEASDFVTLGWGGEEACFPEPDVN